MIVFRRKSIKKCTKKLLFKKKIQIHLLFSVLGFVSACLNGPLQANYNFPPGFAIDRRMKLFTV